jgi:hypothetical protein
VAYVINAVIGNYEDDENLVKKPRKVIVTIEFFNFIHFILKISLHVLLRVMMMMKLLLQSPLSKSENVLTRSQMPVERSESVERNHNLCTMSNILRSQRTTLLLLRESRYGCQISDLRNLISLPFVSQ